MNLLEALNTGKHIKRPSRFWFVNCMDYALAKELNMIDAYHDSIPMFLPPHIAIRHIDIASILATDWEVMEKPITITKTEFLTLYKESLTEDMNQNKYMMFDTTPQGAVAKLINKLFGGNK